MTPEVLLLAVSGILALLGGSLVVLFAPGRFPALVAGGALALSGLVQIGFARVALDVPWGGDVLWFRYTLALTMPAALLWVLTAATLGRPRSAPLSPLWRAYVAIQAVASALCAAWIVATPPPASGEHGMQLDLAARAALAIALLNVVVYAVKFEAVYVSLSRRHRRALRPALAGVLIAAVFYATAAASGLLTGGASISDLAFGAGPVSLLAILVPASFVRGRIGEARIPASQHPVTATTSFLLAAAFVGGTALLFWMTQVMGVGLERAVWLLATVGSMTALLALALSNRARRRAERAVAPLWHDWGGTYRMAAVRAAAPLEECRALDDLVRRIPANAADLTELAEVTLFLEGDERGTFASVASTLEPRPDVRVSKRDPLCVELRRARRPIRLHGRPDDLEYISIYVENREALIACNARFAVPLIGEEDLIGFLVGGARRDGRRRFREPMRLLHFAARRYAALLERQGAGKGGKKGRP